MQLARRSVQEQDRRHRHPTQPASGFTFVTLEDEDGIQNLGNPLAAERGPLLM